MKQKKEKMPEYRIVKYPDKDSKTGHVYFADKKVRKRFLFIPYTVWETAKWSNGQSMHWFDFKQAAADVLKLKLGKKIYK